MNHEENNNAQLTISHELLFLLQWLIAHEEKKIKQIIKKAFKSGLQNKLDHFSKKNNHKKETSSEDLTYIVNDFFNLLEHSLLDAMTSTLTNNHNHHQMIPALDKIDSTVCDSTVVQSSLEKASTEFAKHPEKNNAHQILFHELLKNWKPGSKVMN